MVVLPGPLTFPSFKKLTCQLKTSVVKVNLGVFQPGCRSMCSHRRAVTGIFIATFINTRHSVFSVSS
uniref:Uncharacterized protein n=1 Tax=Anguilla anguilla TaxID=7936 RepID=A0A0E9WDJ7_ANGAN